MPRSQCSNVLNGKCLNPLRTEVYFCHQNQNAKILVILRLYWNIGTHLKGIETSFQVVPLFLLIWKVLRQAFRWYHYFWNPSTFGWVISLFEIFSKYLQCLNGFGLNEATMTAAAKTRLLLHMQSSTWPISRANYLYRYFVCSIFLVKYAWKMFCILE
jgi:hypothetical protein